MKPVASVREAMNLVEAFEGSPNDFQLLIPDELNDPIGINMAIIIDCVLARDWEPNGFIQASGYRIYKYKEWEECP